jgi:hypothetical protein
MAIARMTAEILVISCLPGSLIGCPRNIRLER